MFVIVTPGVPKAKPRCSGAPEGIVIASVYDVSFPIAVHVSRLAARSAAAAVATAMTASASAAIDTPEIRLIADRSTL